MNNGQTADHSRYESQLMRLLRFSTFDKVHCFEQTIFHLVTEADLRQLI